MSEFCISEMLAMQKELQEKYKDKWEKICPDAGKHKLLWMIGEIGEVIDIVKKNGDAKAIEDNDCRKHLIEEMTDVLICSYKQAIFGYVTYTDDINLIATRHVEVVSLLSGTAGTTREA